jgi:hypothetical protein
VIDVFRMVIDVLADQELMSVSRNPSEFDLNTFTFCIIKSFLIN